MSKEMLWDTLESNLQKMIEDIDIEVAAEFPESTPAERLASILGVVMPLVERELREALTREINKRSN